jgi:drug/metabolite transporter (DMT)-like permease
MVKFVDNLSKERQGEVIIFGEAFLWSLFPVITVLSFKNVPTLLALAWSTLFSAIFFAIVLFWKKGWGQIKNKEAIKDILAATFILGIAYYLFYFFGLRHTSPGNAGLIALTEIFFSFLFFNVWRKEYCLRNHIWGALLMLVGAAIVLYPNTSKFQLGDLLVLAASFIAPLGNFFQRRARKIVSSEAILFVRNLISAAFIFILAYFIKIDFSAIDIKGSLILLIINGFFLLGLSKVLWLEGIHRINVAKANALNAIAPLLTLLFAWLLLGNIPTGFQLFSFIPMFFGVILLGMNKKEELSA